MAPRATPDPRPVPASFKMVFFVVTALTVLSFGCFVALVVFGNHGTKETEIPFGERQLYAACSFGWHAGLGAILGLIGGKVTR